MTSRRQHTGIQGLDEILGGGFPPERMYVVQGEPGTGKTTLALQFLMAGVAQGEAGLFVTFSETRNELFQVAASHGWDLTGLALLDLSSFEEHIQPESQNTLFHPSEVELGKVTEVLLREVERINPVRVVFDSLSEILLLAENPLRYRKQILSLKQTFLKRGATVLFLDDLTSTARDLQIQSVAHGVIQLERLNKDFGGARRRLSVVKLRGASFIEGNHDYAIQRGGLAVFPRMIAANTLEGPVSGEAGTGLPEFDMLLGAGLARGTSTLFQGPPGTGKSSLAAYCAFSAARRGERVLIFMFDENISTYLARSAGLGMDFTPLVEQGLVKMQRVDPAELSPGEFASIIRSGVETEAARFVLIDSLNGYLHSMPQEAFLVLQLHELLSYLNAKGVVTILIMAQQGIVGKMDSPIDITYLADTVVLTRFFEASGAVRKAISITKKRTGHHENTIRELEFRDGAIVVGAVLEGFQGILTGVPTLPLPKA